MVVLETQGCKTFMAAFVMVVFVVVNLFSLVYHFPPLCNRKLRTIYFFLAKNLIYIPAFLNCLHFNFLTYATS